MRLPGFVAQYSLTAGSHSYGTDLRNFNATVELIPAVPKGRVGGNRVSCVNAWTADVKACKEKYDNNHDLGAMIVVLLWQTKSTSIVLIHQ